MRDCQRHVVYAVRGARLALIGWDQYSSSVTSEAEVVIRVSFLAVLVNDESNPVAEKAVDVALNYVRRTANTGIQFDSFQRVIANTSDARTLLEARQ